MKTLNFYISGASNTEIPPLKEERRKTFRSSVPHPRVLRKSKMFINITLDYYLGTLIMFAMISYFRRLCTSQRMSYRQVFYSNKAQGNKLFCFFFKFSENQVLRNIIFFPLSCSYINLFYLWETLKKPFSLYQVR